MNCKDWNTCVLLSLIHALFASEEDPFLRCEMAWHSSQIEVSVGCRDDWGVRVVPQGSDRIRECYADGLRRNPKRAGVVRVQFAIDLEGKVTEIVEAPEPSVPAGANAQTNATIQSIRDLEIVSCVLSAFGKLQFARPERGGPSVIYPIRFTP